MLFLLDDISLFPDQEVEIIKGFRIYHVDHLLLWTGVGSSVGSSKA
jgi:hypothetical protein